MASSKAYLDLVTEQLTGLNVSYKKMMGEYLLYLDGVLFGGIYDDRLLIKPTEKAKALLPTAEYAFPYEGAKPMLVCDFVDEKEKLFECIKNLIK